MFIFAVLDFLDSCLFVYMCPHVFGFHLILFIEFYFFLICRELSHSHPDWSGLACILSVCVYYYFRVCLGSIRWYSNYIEFRSNKRDELIPRPNVYGYMCIECSTCESVCMYELKNIESVCACMYVCVYVRAYAVLYCIGLTTVR